jgi:Uma2 family endonuclease
MSVAKKIELISIEQFENNYIGTHCQFHEGVVWESQANSPDHSYAQISIAETLSFLFNRKKGPKKPGGWWILTEAPVRYGTTSFFSHDLAGWKRDRIPDRHRRFPITDRPDWVCEILSTNKLNDLRLKKKVLHDNVVPYYWVVSPTEQYIEVFEWDEKGYISILDFGLEFVGKIPPFDNVTLNAKHLFGEHELEELE